MSDYLLSNERYLVLLRNRARRFRVRRKFKKIGFTFKVNYMIVKIYSIFDEKVGAYLQPFFSVSDGAALRAFLDSCEDPKSPFAKHLADFTLFSIGNFDDSNGHINCHSPISLGNALQLTTQSS